VQLVLPFGRVMHVGDQANQSTDQIARIETGIVCL
jgi:hypothetical protein